MSKELSEMTLEELWQLFPISLVPHKSSWEKQYRGMEQSLKELLSGFPVLRISHIGSTAIKNIMAKDILDVLVEFPKCADLHAAAQLLEAKGFIIMSSGPGRVSLNKGYTKDGFADEVFHIHLRHAGDNDELYFRDYLNEYPETAREYERLKLKLWKEYEHDRDAYTAGKTAFVKETAARAREKYGDRYAPAETGR